MKERKLTASAEREMMRKAEALAAMDIQDVATTPYTARQLRLAKRDVPLAKEQIAYVMPELNQRVQSEILANYTTALERFAYLYRKAINKEVASYV